MKKKKLLSFDEAGQTLVRHFLLLVPPNILNCVDEVIKVAPSSTRKTAFAFRHNLEAVIITASIPELFAIESAKQSRFTRILVSEQLAAREYLDGTDAGKEKAMKVAVRNARKKIRKEIITEKGGRFINESAMHFLFALVDHDKIVKAGEELLRQATVLIWSALEILARDIFLSAVNSNPHHVISLMSNANTQKILQLRNMDLEILAEHNFNVSGCMGQIILRHHDMSTIASIREIYNAMYPTNLELRDALATKYLWILNQRRHLIVHNRAIVDAKYKKNTGEDLEIGSILSVTPKEVEKYLTVVRDVGIAIIKTIM